MTLRSRIHLYAAGRIISHGFRAIAAFDTALAAKGFRQVLTDTPKVNSEVLSFLPPEPSPL